MKDTDSYRKYALLYIIGVAMIGLLNVLDPVPDPFITTFIFSVRTALYIVLLIVWIYALRRRLLISKTRNYLSAMAGFTVALFLIQSVKYRVLDYHPTLMRYAWYSYYIPLGMMCILFVMACISFNDKNRLRGFNEKWLFLPASVFILSVLTNDLHYFYFAPIEGMPFDAGKDDYTNNIGIYFIYAYYVICLVSGLVFLVLAFRSKKELRRKALYPFLFLIPWVFINVLLYYVVITDYKRHPYNISEIFIFGLIGMLEICIRCRLIPYNENYAGFFKSLRIPAAVTNRQLETVYETDLPLGADRETLRQAAESPVFDSGTETRISGKEVRGGYIIWKTDEAPVRRLNRELESTNNTLSSENDLLKAENELKAKEIKLSERKRINGLILSRFSPYLDEIDRLIKTADAASPDIGITVRRISTLNCVVKRGANMLLCADENGLVKSEELKYAVDELAMIYEYSRELNIAVTGFSSFELPSGDMISLFDSARIILDSLCGKGGDIAFIIENGTCTLMTGELAKEALPEISANSVIKSCDGFSLIKLTAKGGGGK